MKKGNKIFVTRTSLPPFEEYCEMIRPLWDSRQMTNMGPLHEQFAAALRERLRCNVTLFSHGHSALEAALDALTFREGAAAERICPERREVITTPFTFVSTVHAIVRCGLTPVFCDVLPSDGTLDPSRLERLISPRTAAILPVHVYGHPCDVQAIGAIAQAHGVSVLYDAAHAFGVQYEGRPLVTFGDASILSFHATKVFSTVEGGAVCYADTVAGMPSGDYSARLDAWKNFGIRDEETCTWPGANAKMNELQAAMGLCNLRHFDEVTSGRKAAAERYREFLQPRIAAGDIALLEPRCGTTSNYSYFPVLLPSMAERDRVFGRLRQSGIHARKYFYPTVPASACYRHRDFPGVDAIPIARDLSGRILCLPLYDGLAPEHIRAVIRNL